MIEILIFWLISGILIIVLSGLSYYYDTLGLIGFSVIFLFGILITLLNAYYLWGSKRKQMGKPDHDSLKNMFTIILIISVLMFVLGGLGYLLNEFEIYKFDPGIKTTLFAFLTAGLLITAGCILSLIYVERNIPSAISGLIMKQQRNLDKIKNESEEIGKDMKSREKDVKDLLVDAAKTSEKNRNEMNRR